MTDHQLLGHTTVNTVGTNKERRKQMATVSVPHTIKLVTDFDDTHPRVKEILTLPDYMLQLMLTKVFTDILKESNVLETANENGTYAVVRLPKDGELDG
jgi:hypothetical protein